MKICIDAGHGLDTPGKRCPDGSMKEYHFNSEVALLVDHLLSQYEDVETILTFSDTRDIPLAERVNKANGWKAEVFVSVHANAAGDDWSSARGIETYVYTTRPAAAMALALAVQRNLIQETGLVDRGVKAADFYLLNKTKMPAILCECGFMTNREEAGLLKSDEYRQKCAKAIVTGLAETYGLKRKAGDHEMKPEDAQKIVNLLGRVYELLPTTQSSYEARTEIKRLADEVRKAGGLPVA